MKTIALTEDLFAGAVSFEKGATWIKPWRLPFSCVKLFPPDDALPARAETPAGVRLGFRTNATQLGLSLVPHAEARLFDLTQRGELLQTARADSGAEQVMFNPLPEGDKTLELWLPQAHPVALGRLFVNEGAEITPFDDPRPKWITYGSSITHCGSAHSPARTWPAVVARQRNLNLTCLGYGGNCHLEPLVAMMLRDLPADVISLKLGINVQGGATLSPRTFQAAVIGFVQILREKHPDIPIALVSPIISPPREEQPNMVGLSLGMMREQIADAVERMAGYGDKNLYYFSGLDIFGEDLVEDYLPDLVHPNGEGYEIMGQNFSRVVFGEMGFS